MSNIKPQSEAYSSCMSEMKARLFLIGNRFDNKIPSTFYLEFMCLQMRKVCELYAFSRLIVNKISYKKVRPDYQKEWNFRTILKIIKKKGTVALPEPFTVKPSKNGKHHFEGFAGKNVSFITEDDIANIFSECSDFIHAENSFKKQKKFYPMTEELFFEWENKLIGWRNELIKFFNCHVTQLDNGEFFDVFLFMEDKNKLVQVVTVKKI